MWRIFVVLTVMVLLSAGADPDAQTRDNRTPLHYAAGDNENPDVVKVLLSAGANPNAKGQFGSSPLHYAVHAVRYSKKLDIVKLLLSAGADPDVSNRDRTPLDLAVEGSNANKSAIIKVLRDAIARKKEKK